MSNLSSRQQCLGEMGVVQWYARCRLPGAGSSLRVLTQKVADTWGNSENPRRFKDVDFESRDYSESDSASRLLSYQELPSLDEVVVTLNDDNLIATLPADRVPDAGSLSKITERVDPSEINIRLYQAGRIVIVSEFRNDDLMIDELALLKNLLKMIAIENSECHFKQSFTWPVFHSKNILVNETCSQDKMLGRWLSSFFLSDTAVLLLFGSAQTELINELAEDRALFFVPLEHSLGELLVAPRRKSLVWKSLLPIRAALSDGVSK